MKAQLKAPFPYFGGKSRIAETVWRALGDVRNYVEPFCGSAVVLLARPDYDPTRHAETINDADGFVVNFWRAVQWAPEETAKYADWPVNEADLIARNDWLFAQKQLLLNRLRSDPEWFDAKIAGWWCWGMCCWVAGRFCNETIKTARKPRLAGIGVGINAIVAPNIYDWFAALSQRLRRVRVVCGDWQRVVTPAVLWYGKVTTGILLDPPYGDGAKCDRQVYSRYDASVSSAVRQWCLEHGDNPNYRIVLCGYEGEGHEVLEQHGWQKVAWKASGGYANKRRPGESLNRYRERLWLSPGCAGKLFA
ncbi:MAG: DNA adenine methylase [Candidatus Sumerlaeaceae bacterium]|nr:DNA adenine methylase [Candidatus Sumerlaeaceae bacterium]